MNKKKLLKLVTKTLEEDEMINEKMKIKDIDRWDSIGRLSILSLLDDIKLEIDINKFMKIKTVKEFLLLIKLND